MLNKRNFPYSVSLRHSNLKWGRGRVPFPQPLAVRPPAPTYAVSMITPLIDFTTTFAVSVPASPCCSSMANCDELGQP